MVLVLGWHRPGSPIGWLMVAVAAELLIYADSGLYNVINYRLGHHWPLGVLWGYFTAGLADMAVLTVMAVHAITHHQIQVDASGQLTLADHAPV